MVREEWERLIADAFGDDPDMALVAYREIETRQLPWLEERVVAMARRNGLPWSVIGRRLGRSRQAVQAKFADRLPRVAPAPRESPYDRRAREQAEAYERIQREYRRRAEVDDDPVAW